MNSQLTVPHSSTARFVGLDVGDRVTHMCVIDSARNVIERRRFETTREGLVLGFKDLEPCQVALEVGSQSPWMSAQLRSMGHDTIVADARRVAAMTKGIRKTDRRDAESVARLLQGMPELLGSIYHRGEQAQADLALIRARDLCVRTRTRMVQHVRGTLKVFGLRVRACSTSAFHHVAEQVVPEKLQPVLGPVLEQIDALGRTIKRYDQELGQAAMERYPAIERLREVNGVGLITASAFVLTVEDPARFKKSRTVGSWVGLCPRVFASGMSDPDLPISKTGCSHLRRLLVQSAQYILGPHGKDSDLKRYGLRICDRGGKAAKGRAVVAVARKLSVLLHRLWVSSEPYNPLRNSEPTTKTD